MLDTKTKTLTPEKPKEKLFMFFNGGKLSCFSFPQHCVCPLNRYSTFFLAMCSIDDDVCVCVWFVIFQLCCCVDIDDGTPCVQLLLYCYFLICISVSSFILLCRFVLQTHCLVCVPIVIVFILQSVLETYVWCCQTSVVATTRQHHTYIYSYMMSVVRSSRLVASRPTVTKYVWLFMLATK